MSDPLGNDTGPPGSLPREPETIDGELNVKAIVYAGVGVVVVTLVSMLLVFWLFQGFKKLEDREDSKPSALPEAAEKLVPPSPRLEISPPENLNELREREATALDAPAWIDQAQGRVRLPIDLALDVVARRGLGEAAPAPAAEPVPAEAATPEGATPEAAAGETPAPAPPAGGPH
jgi:hypothetical protein